MSKCSQSIQLAITTRKYPEGPRGLERGKARRGKYSTPSKRKELNYLLKVIHNTYLSS